MTSEATGSVAMPIVSHSVGDPRPVEEMLAEGWAALPLSYRPPASRPSLAAAQAYCKRLAESHYENFHVASWFLPKRLRPHFYSIYAYCRISDDLGDELDNREQSLALLHWWGGELERCYGGEVTHPVFVALGETIRICDIPKKPFADLLAAFRRDQTVARYATMAEVLDYCRHSANPVGRLVLYASGYRDEARFLLSDATCTALQLANFWQDVREDYGRGRIYLPLADMQRFAVTEEMIAAGRPTPQFRELMQHEVEYARQLFMQGLPLLSLVKDELALDLDLFSRGGLEILHAIEQQGYDVLSSRPAISKRTKMALMLRALGAKLLPSLRSRGSSA